MRAQRIVTSGVLTASLSLSLAPSGVFMRPDALLAMPTAAPQDSSLPGLACIQNALGGARAVAAVSSLRITADTKPAAPSGPRPLPGTREISVVLPERYMRVDVGRFRDGATLRSTAGFNGSELLSSPRFEGGRTMRIARQEFVGQMLMRLPRPLPDVRLSERVVKDRGQERLAIEASSAPDGLRATLLADRGTCVPVAVQYQFPPGGSLHTVRTELSAYREFGGLRFATMIETSHNGVPFTVERVSRVEVNAPGVDKAFASVR